MMHMPVVAALWFKRHIVHGQLAVAAGEACQITVAYEIFRIGCVGLSGLKRQFGRCLAFSSQRTVGQHLGHRTLCSIGSIGTNLGSKHLRQLAQLVVGDAHVARTAHVGHQLPQRP